FDPADHNAPTINEGYGPNFKGYSMGPGWYGKTFFMWPPDPRWTSGASSINLNTSSSLPKDTSGKLICDWRKRFFFDQGTTTPLGDSPSTSDDNRVDNSKLWDSSGNWKQANNSSYSINYTA